MAQRLAISNILIRGIHNSAILRKGAKMSDETVHAGRNLFSPKLFKKHYEIAPLIIIVLGGITILSGFIVRNVLTRDDIRFIPKGKFGYEMEENFDRQRKFINFNQKYGAPEGLKELYEDFKNEN